MHIKKNLAYTLAEVLITLAIIGIIAAIVVPIVAAHIRHQIIEKRFTEAYSKISNIYALSKMENGGIDQWDAFTQDSLLSGDSRAELVNKYIVPYSNGELSKVKLPDIGYKDGIKYPNGNYFVKPTSSVYILRLANGQNIYFNYYY